MANNADKNMTSNKKDIDWMYEDPNALKHEADLDEYALGNKDITQLLSKKHEDDYDRMRKSHVPGANFLTHKKINVNNDALKKIKEDPMVAVQATQLAQLKAALEKKKLMKQIEEKEKKKKKKKKKKREEEEKKRKRHHEEPIFEEEKDRKRKREEKHRKSSHDDNEDRKLREEQEEEERRRKLEQMKNDGKVHELKKKRDILKREEERQRDYKELERSIPHKDAKTTAFLTRFHSEAYLNSGHSLEERIGRNLNRIDRRSNIEE